ncbi:hypothetical protein BDA99DRAFT_82158 [Phascolomyces articulosus]|uniref:C2H2-type domain-containing protein n=1 Tax=Phascolomyces articulosus TaxID=60185 RepID=A0AAD5JZG1_9FUNG|nr:hypothetical protein BDA99DRAFT_82158 [Phascolomyces articulosus]
MLSSVKKFVSKYLVQDSQTVATSSNESTEPKPLQSTNPDEDQWNDQEEHESKKRPLNIEEDRHDSEERPTKRHATEEISTEDNKQQKKEGEFYFCPFKGCSQVYMWRASIVKHIQKTHFKIPRLNTDHCVLQTRSGHIIDFNGKG